MRAPSNLFALAALAALALVSAAAADPVPTGTIHGTIEYPSEDLPPMSVFALGGPEGDYVVRTSPHQKDFVLERAGGDVFDRRLCQRRHLASRRLDRVRHLRGDGLVARTMLSSL